MGPDSASRLRLLLEAELTRRHLLRGALGLASTALLARCGVSNPPGFPEPSTSTSGSSSATTAVATTGSSSSASTATSSSSSSSSSPSSTTSTSSSGATASGSSSSGSSSGSSSASTGTSSSSSGSSCPGSCATGTDTFTVPISQIPVGGGMLFTDPRFSDSSCAGSGYPHDGFAVIQPSAGTFVALSTSCTHACCQVELATVRGTKELVCPCHGSHFSLDGAVLQGPATRSLKSLPVCSDGCNVYVTL